MATKKNTVHRSPRSGKYMPLTVGSVEKETGQPTNIRNKELRVSAYFKQNGFKPLGAALEKLEHNLAK